MVKRDLAIFDARFDAQLDAPFNALEDSPQPKPV